MKIVVEDKQDEEIMKEFEEKDGDVKEVVSGPVVASISAMDFYEALEQTLCGEKIHKLEWKDTNFYAAMEDDILVLHKPDGKKYSWVISKADVEGEDYVIVK